MVPAGDSAAGLSVGRSIRFLSALCLAGVASRLTILAMPPVIPLVHDDLHMSETQIGLLVGLPLAVFAVASVPGSLLIARIGSGLAVMLGMIITAVAGGARGAASGVWTLYALVIVMGFGTAIMQPGMPALVREWVPNRIALGTVVYSCGMLIGATIPAALTVAYVLPFVGGSWRLDLVAWAFPAILVVPVFFALSPRARDQHAADLAIGGQWWPDWRNPVIWLLGLAFGGNTGPYYAVNAFLGDYLTNQGKPELLGPALAWLNGSQILALAFLLMIADRLQGRAWPFVVFGPMVLVALFGIMLVPTPFVVVGAAALMGFAAAVTMTAALALPPLLSAPGDVPRTAAGMFTISYACAILIPTVSGALWDMTGKSWTTFVPSCVFTVLLTVLGAAVTRFRPPAAKKPGR